MSFTNITTDNHALEIKFDRNRIDSYKTHHLWITEEISINKLKCIFNKWDLSDFFRVWSTIL